MSNLKSKINKKNLIISKNFTALFDHWFDIIEENN